MNSSFILCVLAAAATVQAQTIRTVGSFDKADSGASVLIQGLDGNFYGAAGAGTIFKLTPAGVLTTLYTFPKNIAANSLIQASDGSFYGTTGIGGSGACSTFEGDKGCGTFFKMTPGGTVTTLYNFDLTNNAYPSGRLIQASDGNFYGATSLGGPGSCKYFTPPNGCGTIYKITPAGALTTLFTFDVPQGATPNGVIQGADGNFYGTAVAGGTGPCTPFGEGPTGCGTVFKLTPAGVMTNLYTFTASIDGSFPVTGLTQSADGTLYGTTSYGSASLGNVYGSIFKITPAGMFSNVVVFNVADGVMPNNLFRGSDGNIYGSTAGEGSAIENGVVVLPFSSGTIFEVTPAAKLITLYSFCQGTVCPDGFGPNLLVQGSDGNLYGTILGGGVNGLGLVFEFPLVSPDAPAIAANGVLNGASFQAGIASDTWMTISGTNLSSKTDTWDNAIVKGALPTALDGVSVMVGGQPAYIEYVSPTQINAIAPNVPAGAVPVTVTTSKGTSPAVNAQLTAEQPVFFQWGNYAVATRQDFSLAVKNGTFTGTTTVAAKPGDVIILWGTGFGPTSPSTPAGAETPSTTTYNTATPVTVKIGTTQATVYGAALAPSYAGLFQVAIQIPASLANGDYPVVASVNGAASPLATMITVQK